MDGMVDYGQSKDAGVRELAAPLATIISHRAAAALERFVGVDGQVAAELVGFATRGKKVRPLLGLLLTQAAGRSITRDVEATFASLEIAHRGTLILDDVMDGSPTRGPLPSVWVTCGADHAMLASVDYFSVSALTAPPEAVPIITRSLLRINAGQHLDVSPSRTEHLQDVHNRLVILKAGSFVDAAIMLALGSDEALIQKLSACLTPRLAVAYQAANDLQDIAGWLLDPSVPIPEDVRNRKLTYPIVTLAGAGPSARTSALVASYLRYAPIDYEALRLTLLEANVPASLVSRIDQNLDEAATRIAASGMLREFADVLAHLISEDWKALYLPQFSEMVSI